MKCLLLAALMSVSPFAGAHYHVGCHILNEEGKIVWQTMGNYCQFFEDGSLIRYLPQVQKIQLLKGNGEIVWQRKVHVHHQLNLSMDGKRFLFLSSDAKKNHYCMTRYDAYEVADVKTGRTLHRWSNMDHVQLLTSFKKGNVVLMTSDYEAHVKNTQCEFNHSNSIHEIPENPLAAKFPFLKKGNIIVNIQRGDAVVIFDPILKKILWKTNFESEFSNYHDVQVLPSGQILYYQNTERLSSRSSLRIFDLETIKSKVLYPLDPTQEFFCTQGGGQQLLPDGSLLFNTNTADVGGQYMKVDAQGKILWQRPIPFKNQKTGLPFEAQEVREKDLSLFLKNHNG